MLVAAACALALTAGLSSTFGATSPTPAPGLSQAELAGLDSAARSDLAVVASSVHFHARFPAGPPSGYYYSHVVFEKGHPERGFAIWMQTAGSADRGIHIIEAPNDPTAEKNTLNLPGLVPVTLANGTWMVLQKQDDPWKGLWIYATVLDDVHIEVDGANRALVEAIAGSL
jgi:hypothetical protein